MPQHQSLGDLLEVPRPQDGMARLTVQERNVLELVAEGHSNDGIAQRLAVTARTVESHTSRIFAKLGLENDRGTHRRVLAALAHLRASAASAQTRPLNYGVPDQLAGDAFSRAFV